MPVIKSLKFIGIFVFVIGIGLLFLNSLYPHTALVEKSVEVPNDVTVTAERRIQGGSNYVLKGNEYWYYDNLAFRPGEIIKVSWSSDNSITGYIFTQNQFNNYVSSNERTINSEATGSGESRNITCNVQNADNYVAVIKNRSSLFGGSSAQVYQFYIYKITHSTQTQYTTEKQMVPQGDYLYLYIAIPLIIFGISFFAYSFSLESKIIKKGVTS